MDHSASRCQSPAPTRSPALKPHSIRGSKKFQNLIQQHGRVIFSIALRLCGNACDARDLVQETFERALCHFDHFQEGMNGRAWLLTILRHLFINQCRVRAREQSHVPAEDLEERIPAPEDEPPSAWAAFSLDHLLAAVEKLPEEFRKVYQLHAFEGRSYEEIALRLRIPKATVGTRLIRARRKLRELLTVHDGT